MTEVALVCDTHFGARGNNRTLFEHSRRFFEEVFFPELDRRGIPDVVHLGDLVDNRRNIDYNVLRGFKDFFIGEIDKRDIVLHMIVGNHDVSFRNTNRVNAQRSVFDDIDEKNIRIYEEPTVARIGDVSMLLLPWINDENRELSLKLINESSADVVLGHLEVNGARMQGGRLCEHGMSRNLFSKYGLVVSGHFHTRGRYGNVEYWATPTT